MEYLREGGSNPGTNAAVETAGWGSEDNLGSRPDKLKEVVLEVVSAARCRRSDYFGKKFTANMLCAHKICEDPCEKAFRKEDSCDVSVPPLPLTVATRKIQGLLFQPEVLICSTKPQLRLLHVVKSTFRRGETESSGDKDFQKDLSFIVRTGTRTGCGLLQVSGSGVSGGLRRAAALQRRGRGHHLQRREEVWPAEEAWNLHHHLPLHRLDRPGPG